MVRLWDNESLWKLVVVFQFDSDAMLISTLNQAS